MARKMSTLLLTVLCFFYSAIKAADGSLSVVVLENEYIVGKDVKNRNEIDKSAEKLKVSLHEDDSGDDSEIMLHELLEEFQESKNLRKLSISGFCLFDDSIKIIGKIKNIHTIKFDQCSFANVSDFNNLNQLVNLENIFIKKSDFSRDSKDTDEDISFKSFAETLDTLASIKVLSLEGSTLFPVVLKRKAFGRKKVDKIAFDNYCDYRKTQIEDCAQLLASNFHGVELVLTDTNLGRLFMTEFTNHFIYNHPMKINFSGNYIEDDLAVNFIIKFRDKRLTLCFTGNQCSFSDIQQKVFDHFITDLILED